MERIAGMKSLPSDDELGSSWAFMESQPVVPVVMLFSLLFLWTHFGSVSTKRFALKLSKIEKGERDACVKERKLEANHWSRRSSLCFCWSVSDDLK